MQHIPAARRSFVPTRITLEIGGTKRQGFVQSRRGDAADHASRVVGAQKTTDSRLYVKAVIQQPCNAPTRNEPPVTRTVSCVAIFLLLDAFPAYQHIRVSKTQ
jgi:hypothetical protein